MGLFTPIYSENGPSIEFAVIEILDLVAQRAGLDDVMQTPFLPDRGDGVGAPLRPTTTVTLRAKVSVFPQSDEQKQDQTGNDPDSKLSLTLYDEDLVEAGLLAAGALSLKPGDRLVRLENSDGIIGSDGTIRVDFAHHGRRGLRCLEVRPGLTGEGLTTMVFESQKASELGLSSS